MQKKWLYRKRRDGQPISREFLAAADRLGLSPRTASIFWERGLADGEEIALFLSPMLRHLEQPACWPGITDAANLIFDGLMQGKKLAVWGDYDVDGITATALVDQVLDYYGVKIECHLPERQSEGYGLNEQHIEKLAAAGIDILLTVDCGISDTVSVQKAVDLGLTVIISDHHLPPEKLPPAHVLCNPRLGDCPCRHLAGVGVAFFLMAALNGKLAENTAKPKFDMRQTLDLVALGTLADMVPLEGQNRVLVKNGLLKISEAERPGLAELKNISGFAPSAPLGAGQVVFSLAPRINAAGRMADASLALELLREQDSGKAAQIASLLNSHNLARRQEEEIITGQALNMAEQEKDKAAFVLLGEDWNQGIIGIVASRLVERYHKPTLIVCRDGSSLKGSGRSIDCFDLHASLASCEKLLEGYGGHKMAAGIRVHPSKFLEFKYSFISYVTKILGEKPIQPSLSLDGELSFKEASDFIFLKELQEMQPFGTGNPEPSFSSPVLLVKKRRLFGPQRNHVNLELQDESCGILLHAKAWRQAEELPQSMENRHIRIAYSPTLDTYNGFTSVNLKIKDWHYLDD